MRITLGGDLGSGKSSVGRRLSERLGVPYVSAGKLFREIGQIANLDALATNLEAESNTDIDAQVDQRTKDLDRELGDFIIDSRMGWHFVSHAVRVYLSVRATTAARRILADSTRDTESYPDLASALVMLRRRRESEQKRYRTLYGVDIEERNNYDLWLITDDAAVDDICEIIIAFAAGRTRHTEWIPKVRLVPTVGIQDPSLARLAAAPRPPDDFAVPLLVRENFGFFFERADMLMSAFKYETTLVPYRSAKPAPMEGSSLNEVLSLVGDDDLADWEKAFGIQLSVRKELQGRRSATKTRAQR